MQAALQDSRRREAAIDPGRDAFSPYLQTKIRVSAPPVPSTGTPPPLSRPQPPRPRISGLRPRVPFQPVPATTPRAAQGSHRPTVSLDIARLLQDWPYEPGSVNVRLIEGDDGVPRIQMRVDLGILQMEIEGRPDGERPEGFESLLELHEIEADDAEAGDEAAERALDADACRLLREEAVQYYHRYVSLLVLEDYEGVVRDTSRNLRLLDFMSANAEEEEDRSALESFRPYLLMMRTRALASRLLSAGEAKAASLAIEMGLDSMRRYFERVGRPDQYESSNEAALLRGMRDALAPKLPVSQREELKQRLQQALAQENYELAAILRDELRMMREPGD